MSRASRNKLPRLTKGRKRQAARQDARKAREASKLAAKPEKAAQKARDQQEKDKPTT
jgi:hypothetical protein